MISIIQDTACSIRRYHTQPKFASLLTLGLLLLPTVPVKGIACAASDGKGLLTPFLRTQLVCDEITSAENASMFSTAVVFAAY